MLLCIYACVCIFAFICIRVCVCVFVCVYLNLVASAGEDNESALEANSNQEPGGTSLSLRPACHPLVISITTNKQTHRWERNLYYQQSEKDVWMLHSSRNISLHQFKTSNALVQSRRLEDYFAKFVRKLKDWTWESYQKKVFRIFHFLLCWLSQDLEMTCLLLETVTASKRWLLMTTPHYYWIVYYTLLLRRNAGHFWRRLAALKIMRSGSGAEEFNDDWLARNHQSTFWSGCWLWKMMTKMVMIDIWW